MRKELMDLRNAMKQAGIDMYILSSEDIYGMQCRMYVSGFTGSAGTLLVTQDWAGLWTDGRFFIQAAQQLSGSGIDLCKMGEPGSPTEHEWLEQHLKAGMTLGFDGKCMTAHSGSQLREIAVQRGAEIRYEGDLVGTFWTDRPSMPVSPVWELDLRYSGQSRRDKLAAVRQRMKLLGADRFVLASFDDIAWLLNIRGSEIPFCPITLSNLVLTENKAVLYADEEKYDANLRQALAEDGVILRPYDAVYGDVKEFPAQGCTLVDPDKVNFALLRSICGTLLKRTNPTEQMKAVKNPVEQENIRTAHVKDGVALTKFMKWLYDHVGSEEITELSAAKKLEEFRAQQEHYLGPSFTPIFAYGEHGAIVHYSATKASNVAVQPEGFLLSDTGGQYLEGTTDVTRTFVVGPITGQMKYHFTLVLKGHLHLLNGVFKQGCTGAAIDVLAREPLWAVGLDYDHGTGHGVGYLLAVHEGPQSIRYTEAGMKAELEPGMITSDEPGFYLEGQYGIRHESLMLCVVRDTNEFGTFLGFEPLTLCPFDLNAVEVELLSEQERQWLNEYHALVYEKLSPYLNEEETAWLKKATRKI